MKKFDQIRLHNNSTIKEALKIIDGGAMQIAVVLNKKGELIGTITDGDIRRGLLQGLALEDSISSILFKHPTTAHINDSRDIILQKALAKKLRQIPILDDNGVLVGIEEIDELVRPEYHPNKIVLMAGGLGTRLAPLTQNTPKPLLKVGNKPILETIIENFSKYGFTEIILSVNYKAHMIEEYFKDGSKFGVNIQYIHETKRMGTAGALSLMKEQLTQPFFVMNGDLLTNINFEHMLDFHNVTHSIATMGVREYDFQVPYGVVNVDGHTITGIEEKPVQKFFVSGGIYILNPDILSYIPDDQFYDMPTLFEKLIQEHQKTVSFPIREYWLDIGRMSDYERANDEYREIFE